MNSRPKQLRLYDYELPESFIAQAPAQPRDSSKLLVFDRRSGAIHIDVFRTLGTYVPPRTVLVFNQSKVFPARLVVKKPTGGRVVLLVLGWVGRDITAVSDRRLTIGHTLRCGRHAFQVASQAGGRFRLRALFASSEILKLLQRYGQTPIPPYIKHSPLSEANLKRRYQTVFATDIGSAAAPTAGLHFTTNLLKSLRRRGVAVEYLTLHVGLGTFSSVTSQQLRLGRLHRESYSLSSTVAGRLNRYKAEGRPIIAVGTTVARTLESATRRGRLRAGSGQTDIFIRPGYRWKFVDGLITNFHVPRSSLMMLVASMIGRTRLLALYEYAKKNKFRFFSFGDSMFIRP